jgi:hypothetical protein
VVLALDDLLIEGGKIAPFSPAETTYTAMGRFGNMLLVVGEPELALAARAGEVVRLWLTNTTNIRVFNVRRHAKTDKTDARHLRMLLAEGPREDVHRRQARLPGVSAGQPAPGKGPAACLTDGRHGKEGHAATGHYRTPARARRRRRLSSRPGADRQPGSRTTSRPTAVGSPRYRIHHHILAGAQEPYSSGTLGSPRRSVRAEILAAPGPAAPIRPGRPALASGTFGSGVERPGGWMLMSRGDSDERGQDTAGGGPGRTGAVGRPVDSTVRGS